MPERVVILVDGSNFYHRLRELGLPHLLTFNYKAFGRFLTGKDQLLRSTYYIGAVRAKADDQKGRELMANQQKLFTQLKKQGWNIALGDMLNTDGIYREKGVDVQIAVDLVAGAYEDQYDTAILVSSDSDLLPALEKVQAKGKHITYVGFSHKPSHALIAHSNIRRLLTREDLEQFLPAQEL
jgi:uncharacterized LabA/DUF88 family protein